MKLEASGAEGCKARQKRMQCPQLALAHRLAQQCTAERENVMRGV